MTRATLRERYRSTRAWPRELVARRPVEAAVFGITFVLVAASVRPETPQGTTGGFEQWMNLTNSMFYGQQDFLFTYGPLFWLTGGTPTQYSAVTYWAAVLFVSTVNASFWALLVGACHRVRAYVLLAAAFFLFFRSPVQREALLLLPILGVAYFDFSARREAALPPRWLVALGLVVGSCFYIRFMYGVVALLSFGGYLAYRAVVRRTVREGAALLVGTLAGYAIVGLVVFHHPTSLFTYFRINSQLSVGNSIDMRLDVVESTNVLTAGLGVVLAVTAYVALRRRSLLLPVGLLMLLLLKLGFGRNDHYLTYFVIPAAAVALILALDASKTGRTATASVMAALYLMASTGSFDLAPKQDALATETKFAQSYAERVQATYKSFALSREVVQRIGTGTVDVYPYNNEYAFANRLNYHHRPLFQSYMTLTPALDAMNARFFASRERPRFVLWTTGLTACKPQGCNPFDDFDDKYTPNEDPLTTSSILLNYHVVMQTRSKEGAPLTLLEQNHGLTRYTSSTLGAEVMRFGTWYPVPRAAGGGLVKVRPEFQRTVYGRLKDTLFRGSIMKVRYRLVDGQVREYRLNSLNAASGVQASPLLDDLAFSGTQVEAVQFVTTARTWAPTFRATWISLPVTLATTRPALHKISMIPATSKPGITCDGSLDEVNGATPRAGATVSGTLRIRGWLAYSSAQGIPVEETFLTLKRADGATFKAATDPQQRPDLITAFNSPRLASSGFTSVIDVSALTGRFTLGLAGRQGGRTFTCRQLAVQLTLEADPR